jgi:hypothetical protein
MNTGYHIDYLRRREIDTTRWDACIAASANGLIYAKSFYLDAMTAGQWDALILDDYTAVMPLPWRKKAGIRYLYPPAFTQQLGIFSAGNITPEYSAAFLAQLPNHFRFAEIFLNYANPIPHAASTHSNFILSLKASYQQLSAQYKGDLLRNLQLAQRNNLSYVKNVDLHSSLEAYRREYGGRMQHVKEEDYRRFGQLCTQLQQKGQLLTRAVYTINGELLATALMPADNAGVTPANLAGDARAYATATARMYLLQSTTTATGRELAANHFLLDNIIMESAGSNRILDFEGSDIPGIAHFYRNFGSIDQPYFFYRYNQLPWPLRLFKK